MAELIKQGFIRMNTTSGGIEMGASPGPKQREALKTLFANSRGDIRVDVAGPLKSFDGEFYRQDHTPLRFPAGTKPEVIFDAIDSTFWGSN